MHALPSHPFSLITLAVAAALAVVVLMLTAGLELGALDLSLGGGAADPQPVTDTPPANPTWLHDPLASPIETLTGKS